MALWKDFPALFKKRRLSERLLSGPVLFLSTTCTLRQYVFESSNSPSNADAFSALETAMECIWNCFLETGSAGRTPGQGRRLATTPNEDRYLVLTVCMLADRWCVSD
ncbi:hypothetical protein TNCV_2667361 [Trichonephila clavipes]|nr:hypothetical protein TNCV_2667361 [Trichonephila clavipes]